MAQNRSYQQAPWFHPKPSQTNLGRGGKKGLPYRCLGYRCKILLPSRPVRKKFIESCSPYTKYQQPPVVRNLGHVQKSEDRVSSCDEKQAKEDAYTQNQPGTEDNQVEGQSIIFRQREVDRISQGCKRYNDGNERRKEREHPKILRRVKSGDHLVGLVAKHFTH